MIRFAGALKALGILVLLAVLAAAVGAGGAYWYLEPKLPSAETLRDVRLQVPLRVYTRDDQLMAEFGEKRRTPLQLHEIPERLIQAFAVARRACGLQRMLEDRRIESAACSSTNPCFALSTHRGPGMSWSAVWRRSCTAMRV